MEETFDEMMRRYREELLHYDRMQRAAAEASNRQSDRAADAADSAQPDSAQPVMEAAAPPTDDRGMTDRGKAARQEAADGNSPLQPQGNPEEDSGPNRQDASYATYTLPDTDEGYMIVQLSAAQSSIPVANADVLITREAEDGVYLVWHAVTDTSGKTKRIALPAPARAASEAPSDSIPYAVYNIRAFAPGFYTINNYDAQVFGGETSIAAINMIPKMETEQNTPEELSFLTPPSGLLDS